MEYSSTNLFSIISFSLICIFGLIGNSLVIYVYGFLWSKKFSKFERLMLLLGIFDLLASIINPGFFIYKITTNYSRWDFGKYGCTIIPALGPIFTNISLGIILIMAIDRDRAVATPFKKQFTVATIYKGFGITIILSIAVCIPYMLNLTLYEGKYCGVWERGPMYDYFIIILFLTSDIVFIIIFGVSTVRMYLKLKQKYTVNVLSPSTKRTKETNRILRLVIAMGILFSLCIFPRDLLHVSYHLSNLYPPRMDTKKISRVNEILKVLHASNSCINVILYSVLNIRFRRELYHFIMKIPYFQTVFHYKGKPNESYMNNESSVALNRHKDMQTTIC